MILTDFKLIIEQFKFKVNVNLKNLYLSTYKRLNINDWFKNIYDFCRCIKLLNYNGIAIDFTLNKLNQKATAKK